MVELIENRIYRDGKEVFHLTEEEQDELCNQLYPGEFNKQSESITGIRLKNMEYIPDKPIVFPKIDPIPELLHGLDAKNRIEAIYNAGSISLASKELGIKESALWVYVRRWALNNAVLKTHFLHILGLEIDKTDETEITEEYIYKLGGPRLVCLAKHAMSVTNAAKELGIPRNTLKVWYLRWKRKNRCIDTKMLKRYTLYK